MTTTDGRTWTAGLRTEGDDGTNDGTDGRTENNTDDDDEDNDNDEIRRCKLYMAIMKT